MKSKSELRFLKTGYCTRNWYII